MTAEMMIEREMKTEAIKIASATFWSASISLMIEKGDNVRITHQHRHKINIPINEYTNVEIISAPEISAKSSNLSLLFHAAIYAAANSTNPNGSI